MISQKDIKELDFNTIEEYFEYILDSRANGQRKQAQELYKKLSTRQKNDFENWFDVYTYYDRADEDETTSESINDMLAYLKN